MPAGLLARVTHNLYKSHAEQQQHPSSSSSSSSDSPPSPSKENPASGPAYAHPKLPAAAYLESPTFDPYSPSPTLVLPDPADTLQFQALAIDRPTSPSVAHPAPVVCPAPAKQQQQQMRSVCARPLLACAPRQRPAARARLPLARRSQADPPSPFPARPPSRSPRLPSLCCCLPFSSDPYNGIPSGLPNRAPPTPSSSSNGSIGSGSSYHSGPQQTGDRNLSAALRGEYHPASKPNLPHPSSSQGYGTYSEPMSVDAPQPSPSYDSSAPPVPAATQAPTPASIAADQAAVAQAALRQAEQNARVAQIHAAAVAKTNAVSGGNGGGEAVKVRKTAGKYALKDFEVART